METRETLPTKSLLPSQNSDIAQTQQDHAPSQEHKILIELIEDLDEKREVSNPQVSSAFPLLGRLKADITTDEECIAVGFISLPAFG